MIRKGMKLVTTSLKNLGLLSKRNLNQNDILWHINKAFHLEGKNKSDSKTNKPT